MGSVPADDFINRLARYIQTNAARLAAGGSSSSRRPPSSSSSGSSLWPLSAPPKPLALHITPNNLYYLLLRFDAIGLDVGPLDVRLAEEARRGVSFVDPAVREGQRRKDWSETGSFRSMTSAVSSLSLGGWWNSSKVDDPDATLKLIYSAFTKLPSLVLHAAGLADESIQEMDGTGPLDCCVPLKVFRNLQSLEIHSLPPAALLIPSSPILRSVIVRDVDSPSSDETDWLVPALFTGPGDTSSAPGNGLPNLGRGRKTVERTSQPSAGADVMADLEEDEEDSDAFSDGTTSAPQLVLPATPTIARFTSLSHLSLSHLSLVTLPRLPLPSVVSLDLSHNLLLDLPPNLVFLPSVVSLNLEGNMIQSLRGADQVLPAPSLAAASRTPSKRLRSATGLRVLNLDHNRISNLHGLAAVGTLERLSVRHNELRESQELHRLVPLPALRELYVRPNPFVQLAGEEDWRVGLWEAFAREGRAEADCPTVDGEGVGWGERRRMRVKFPMMSRLGGTSRLISTPRSPDVVPVGGRRSASPAAGRLSPVGAAQRTAQGGLTTPARSAVASPKPKRRKQRIVDLDGGNGGGGYESDASTAVEGSAVARPASPERNGAITQPPPEATATLPAPPTTHSSLKLPSPSKSSHARRALSSSVYSSNPSPARADETPASSPPPPTAAAAGSEEFRRRLEGLRNDVGDSWLRVLSAGGGGSSGGGTPRADEANDVEKEVEEEEANAEGATAPVVQLDAQGEPASSPPAVDQSPAAGEGAPPAAHQPEPVVQVVKRKKKGGGGKKKRKA